MSTIQTTSTCFDNIITVTGLCEDTTSESGITLNDVGIDVSELNQLITKDFADAADFFEKKKDFAIKIITNQIHTAMRPKYKAVSLLQNAVAGYFQPNKKENCWEKQN